MNNLQQNGSDCMLAVATSLVGGQEDEQEDTTEDDGASEIELP